MKIIIGANAELAQDFIGCQNPEELILVSRDVPKIIRTVPHIRWIASDYIDSCSLFKAIERENPKEVSVVWFAAPFPRKMLVQNSSVEIDEVVRQGVTFPVDLVRQLVEIMILEKYGRFVFIGSRLAEFGDIGSSLYTIIKGAQTALSRSLAVEYARFGVTSNVISLGPTDFGLALGLPDSRKIEYRQRTSNRNFVSAAGLSSTINFLIANSDVNGAIVNLDAGLR